MFPQSTQEEDTITTTTATIGASPLLQVQKALLSIHDAGIPTGSSVIKRQSRRSPLQNNVLLLRSATRCDALITDYYFPHHFYLFLQITHCEIKKREKKIYIYIALLCQTGSLTGSCSLCELGKLNEYSTDHGFECLFWVCQLYKYFEFRTQCSCRYIKISNVFDNICVWLFYFISADSFDIFYNKRFIWIFVIKCNFNHVTVIFEWNLFLWTHSPYQSNQCTFFLYLCVFKAEFQSGQYRFHLPINISSKQTSERASAGE